MDAPLKSLRLAFLVGCSVLTLPAQTAPVIVEAEAGTLGADIRTGTEGATSFIHCPSEVPNGSYPGAPRVATYTVVFPEAGVYELYLRMRVGPRGDQDDSLFFATGFGTKDPVVAGDWVFVNNLSTRGHLVSTAVVDGGGSVGSFVWKWINLSAFVGGGTPFTFTVPAGALTQTFQIGVRESGFDMDRIAFGRSGTTYTVATLSAGTTAYERSGPPLATGLTKFLGVAHSPAQAPGLPAYFNQVTPENAGKWGSVEATRDVMNWTELDEAYALAKENNFPFRFHVLIWGNQQPTWIATLPAAEQLEEIEEWFKAVAARYPAIDYLEVVNEPISDPPDGVDSTPGNVPTDGNYINALGGTGISGWEWVLSAFRMARLHFPPTTKLVLNEYSVTNDAAKMQTYVGIVNRLKAEGLIDIVAVQGHAFSTRVPAATITANLNTLAATGLPIMVTELDVDSATVQDGAQDAQRQLSDYQQIFPAFWDHPSVMGVTLWGYRPGLWRHRFGANIVLDDGTERPAMQWLTTYVLGDRVAVGGLPRSASAAVGGTVALTAAVNGNPAPTLQWRLNGAPVAGATAATLDLPQLQPAHTGIYTAVAASGGPEVSSEATIVGVTTTEKFVGTAESAGNDIRHPNTNVFDQVLLTGVAETITADHALNQITRTSFIDIDGDIVQVEFAGPGSLSLVLVGYPGQRAEPEKYNQPGVLYAKGHAGIVIVGATKDTNVSVFSVGRATAYDPTGKYNILLAPSSTNKPANNGSSLFVGHTATQYDGIADIAFIAIASTDGRFGGIRTANANYFAERGITGIYAPGVAFGGPVYIGDITASGTAKPMIILGTAATTQITGGDMLQTNGEPVEVSGIDLLRFVEGSDSHGTLLPALRNAAVFRQRGTNVTADIVVSP